MSISHFHLPSLKSFVLDFDNQKEIGNGTFGTVWRARSRRDFKYYAVKQQIYEIGQNLEREVNSLKMLNHPCVIRYYNDWIERRYPRSYLYIQMELMDFSLDNLLKDPKFIESPFNRLGRSFILFQLASGLAYIHSKKIIHRDIKPANILGYKYKDLWKVKISDFGLATSHERYGKLSMMHTMGNGTPLYCAPEVDFSTRYNEKSDIFSMGIVFYEVLRNPGNSFNIFDFRLFIIRQMMLPKNWLKGYPVEEEVILRMVRFDPKKRPSMSKIYPDMLICMRQELEQNPSLYLKLDELLK
uniref:non-specific serine/threonine protein kinase n=1 Tax=Parastrongyloides trichosuri TaxID=131310 RepID=A0A0N4Z5U3_PARTI